MSGIGAYAAGAGAALDTSTYGLLVGQTALVKSRLDTLTEQASSGLVSSVFSGLGGSAKAALDLSSEIGQHTAQISGLDAAGGRLTLTQSVLTQISGIASSFYAQVNTIGSGGVGDVDVVAASAQASLRQLAGLLNTQDGGTYIFAGTDTGTPPVPSGDAILSSSYYTAISGAVAALAGNGAAATIASTFGTAVSNAAGVSPFSAALSQPAAVLAGSAPSVTADAGSRIAIGVVASANGAAVSAGSSTTGSYIRDLMRSLATLGSLTGAQTGADGYAALLQDTRTSLSGAVDAISDEQGILGNTQTRLTSAATLLTDTNTALGSQLSDIQDVDIASVSTQLTQTQANLQASYKLISEMGENSLLKYL